MTERITHYPDYDVMSLKEEWDSNTREIVLKRLGPFPEKKLLSAHEQEMLKIISMHIIYDNHNDVIDWILHFIDKKLNNNIGESQRKPKVPPEKTLVKEGLKAIDEVAKQKYNNDFLNITIKQQFEILSALQLGKEVQIPEWSKIPQKALFKKLAELIITAYYSHPIIWSEIGFGGPAYPRGYVRIEFGLADPWEAKKEDATSYGFGEEDNNGKSESS